MAAKKTTNSMNFPFPMGKLFPAASFATVSVSLLVNTIPTDADGVTQDNKFNRISIRAHPSNTANIYICNSAAAPDLTAFTNVIDIITKGQLWERSKEWANHLDISKIFVGADNNADYAVASIDQY